MPLEVSDIILTNALLYYSDNLSEPDPPDTLAAGEPWGTPEVQTLTIDASGGTFTLNFDGETTGDLAYNIPVADLQAALEALPSIGAAQVTVTGTPGTSYVITFGDKFAGFDVPLLIVDDSDLTGDTPEAAVAETTPGSGWKRVGFTGAPLTLAYEYEVVDADIQESLAPVDRAKTSEGLMAETTIAELNPVVQHLQWGGIIEVTPAGPGQPGKTRLKIGGDNKLKKRRFGIEGRYVDEEGREFPVRFVMHRATAAQGSSLEFSKSAYVGAPVQFRALADMNRPYGERLFYFDKITEPATS